MTSRDLNISGLIADTVREVGDKGVPSGVIYSFLMRYGIDLSTYNFIIANLVEERVIVKHGYVLYPSKNEVIR